MSFVMNFACHRMLGTPHLAVELLASQQGPCSVELFEKVDINLVLFQGNSCLHLHNVRIGGSSSFCSVGKFHQTALCCIAEYSNLCWQNFLVVILFLEMSDFQMFGSIFTLFCFGRI
jgi:hypothetical protein